MPQFVWEPVIPSNPHFRGEESSTVTKKILRAGIGNAQDDMFRSLQTEARPTPGCGAASE